MGRRICWVPLLVASASLAAEAFEPPTERTFAEGMNLHDIATDCYGNRAFYRMVGLYSGVDPHRVPVGALIKTPTLFEIFEDLGLIPEYQEELTGIFDVLSGYQDLLLVYHELRDEASGYARAGRLELPSEMVARFNELADELARSASQIETHSGRQGEVPTQFLTELHRAELGLRELATGRMDGIGYDEDWVFKRIAHGLADAVTWSREQRVKASQPPSILP